MFAGSFSSYPLTFTYVGQAEAPQGKADVIEAKAAPNFTVRLFVNSETHLPIMVSWQAPAGRGGPGRGGPGRWARTPGLARHQGPKDGGRRPTGSRPARSAGRRNTPARCALAAGCAAAGRIGTCSCRGSSASAGCHAASSAAAGWRAATAGRVRQVRRRGRGTRSFGPSARAGRVPDLLRRLSRRRRDAVAVQAAARHRNGHDRGDHVRSVPGEHEDRFEEV